MTRGNSRQFGLLFPLSIIDRAIHPVESEGIGYRAVMGGIVILAHYTVHFTREHETLV